MNSTLAQFSFVRVFNLFALAETTESGCGQALEGKPNRVDFLGPPGVGKSTLCRIALADHKIAASWISMPSAQHLAERRAYRLRGERLTIVQRMRLFIGLLRHGMQNYLVQGRRSPFVCGRELDRLKDEVLNEFLQNEHILFDAMAEQWFDPDMPLPCRGARFHEMSRWTREWAFTMAFSGPVSILADNSRYTRGLAEFTSTTTLGKSDIDQLICSYAESVLRPSGIIHIDADADLIVKRIKSRANDGSLNSAHEGLSTAALLAYTDKRLAVNRVAVDAFRSIGVPVLSLRAGLQADRQVSEIATFLRKQNRTASSVK